MARKWLSTEDIHQVTQDDSDDFRQIRQIGENQQKTMPEPQVSEGTKDINTNGRYPQIIEDNDEYDPHLYLNEPHAASYLVALAHILKSMLGIGILAMPKAFSGSGYVIGIIGTLLVGILLTYCVHVLVRSQYILCKRHRIPKITYEATMRMALENGPQLFRCFAPYGGVMVTGFMLTTQLGSCTTYTLFVANSLKEVITPVWKDIDIKLYVLMLLLPLLLLACIRNLKVLAPFSTFANGCIVVGVVFIFLEIIQNSDDLEISQINTVGQLQNIPLFFGTTIFALNAINICVTIEPKMKKPKQFVATFGVLNCSMATATILYVTFGFMGYLKYKDDIKDCITMNLPINEPTMIAAKVLFAVDLLISFGLQFFVSFEIIWHIWCKHFNNNLLTEMCLRIVTALVPFLIAMSYQGIGIFISLIGALCFSMLCVTFPMFIEICVLYPKFGRCQIVLIRGIIIILIGIVVLVTGVGRSIDNIISELSKQINSTSSY